MLPQETVLKLFVDDVVLIDCAGYVGYKPDQPKFAVVHRKAGIFRTLGTGNTPEEAIEKSLKDNNSFARTQ